VRSIGSMPMRCAQFEHRILDLVPETDVYEFCSGDRASISFGLEAQKHAACAVEEYVVRVRGPHWEVVSVDKGPDQPRAGQPKVGIDQRVIREIHRRVPWGQSPLLTPGEYRRGENRVVDPDGGTIFTTPPSGDVPSLMDELGAWLTNQSGSLDAPTAAALSHLEFVAIHPFNDGNGRTARAISRLILLRHGYAFDGLVSLDAQLDLDRAAYFSAIRAAIGRSYEPG
jgi:hypothetical protein